MKKHANVVVLVLVLLAGVATPSFAAATNPEAANLFQQAEEAYKAKDLDKASTLLNDALKKEPDNAVYRYIFGRVLISKSDFLTAKENLDVVARSRPIPDKGKDYNEKLKAFKKKIKDLQETFNSEGEKKFAVYLQNSSSKEELKLAVTLFQAFRLNPPLRYKNFEELKKATDTYEKALKKNSNDWPKIPMLQLAFLYEIANKKDKAADIYMRALDYVQDPNEEYIITHKFDYLNRSNKEKLLDTIEAGEFTQKDLEELIGSGTQKMDEDDKKKIDQMITDAKSKLEDATTDEDRERVLEEIKASIIEKQKKGELPGQDKLEEKLKKEGKSVEDYMKEKGF